MMRRDADDVDPNKILLLAGLGLFALMTPFVLGGLKPASPAPLMQSLVRMFAPGEPAIAPALSAAPSSRPHQSHHASAQIVAVPAQQRLVAAPAIDAGIPIIIVPTPELPQSPPLKEESVASDTEELVCRPPQQLRDSRLPGPRVCLPKREWDRMAAQDLQLMPDGRTVAGGFEREHTLDGRVCRMVAVNTGTAAATLNFSCF
jgi:hypothetical protein